MPPAEITFDINKKEVYVGDRVIDKLFFLYDVPNLVERKFAKIPLGCGGHSAKSEGGKARRRRGSKDYNKAVCDSLGMAPRKFISVFNAVMAKVWIRPVEWYVNRLCYDSSGRVHPAKIMQVWEVKEELEQARKDGLDHLCPLILLLKMSPEAIRKVVGKGVWKKLAGNSFSRNKLLYQRIYADYAQYHNHNLMVEKVKLVEKVKELNKLPSTILGYPRITSIVYRYSPEGVLWALKNRDCYLKEKGKIQGLCITYNDTKQMKYTLGEPFNPEWCLKRMKEEHDLASDAITLRQMKAAMRDYPYKEIFKDYSRQYGDFTASPILDGRELAQEGRAMHHCVASYHKRCCNEEYLVISIRKEDRYSTLGIRLKKGMGGERLWLADQHYKACNHDVDDPDAEHLAQLVVRDMEAALAPKKDPVEHTENEEAPA